MSVVARRVAVYLPTLFQQSGRLSIRFDLPRRKFTAITRGGFKRSDVIGDISKAFGRRCTHGKGETSQDVTFVLLRWSKQIWDKMFGKYLLVTNVLGSGVLMVVGDVIVQEYEYRHGLQQQDRYDGARMYRMFVAGALQAPLQHFVYKWMDRIMPHRTFINIMRKILIDQLFMSPACIVIFFYSTCYLERQTLQETNQELISKFPYIYLMDWLTWPAAQYINFRYLDTKYRVAFVNVYTAVYNVLLSYIKHDFGIQLPLEPNSSSVSPKTADTTEVSTTASKTTS